jgi:hypothetical protein
MVHLKSDLEKKLWRQAALAALRTVEGINSAENEKALKFTTVVADGFILAYRQRCKNAENE